MSKIMRFQPARLALVSAMLFGAIGAGTAPMAQADDTDRRPGFRTDDRRNDRRDDRQDRREVHQDKRQDRREVRQEARQDGRDTRREVRQDVRQDRREVRTEVRQDRREARTEVRQDQRNDRRDIRTDRRDIRTERRDNGIEFRRDRAAEHRYYPHRGAVIQALPHGHRMINYRNTRYYFDNGVWYRPFGASFVVIAPPIGIFVPILPLGYITMQIGSSAYYVANDVYYAPRGDGYVVVEPPEGAAAYSTDDYSAGQEQIFIYPRKGQSEQQQARDRYECHSWAREQTGFDPTRQIGSISSAQLDALRSDYHRAMGACLDARGYTVR